MSKILIIGNGPSVLNNKYGNHIDSDKWDVVMRFNRWNKNDDGTEHNDYSEHIGTRCDYWMINDLRLNIWTELYNDSSIKIYNRNLQKSYINILLDIMKNEKTQSNYYKRFGINIKFDASDIRPIVLGEIMELEKLIKSKIKKTKDKNTLNHLRYLLLNISEVTDDIN